MLRINIPVTAENHSQAMKKAIKFWAIAPKKEVQDTISLMNMDTSEFEQISQEDLDGLVTDNQ